jgi:hypothetical protein
LHSTRISRIIGLAGLIAKIFWGGFLEIEEVVFRAE